MIYITIDGGTTNTRISLVSDKEIKDTVKLNVGARANMNGDGILQKAIGEGIKKLLSSNNITEKDVLCILASGMITSEFNVVRYHNHSCTIVLQIAQNTCKFHTAFYF